MTSYKGCNKCGYVWEAMACLGYFGEESGCGCAPIDAINPPHYTSHPSGIECIDVAEHFNFNIGNAIKYLWRCDLKTDAIEDLEKAIWYVNREIERRS